MSVKSSDSAKKLLGTLNKSNNEDSEIETIEKHIQNILNSLIKGLQLLSAKDSTFDKFQNVFYKSESLEEYLSGLHEMVEQLVRSMQAKLRADRNDPRPSHFESSSNPNESTMLNHKILNDPHYGNLEKVLQKYEAEIREHIRIEQQLKIYSDGLEEKIKETEKEMASKVEHLQGRVGQLEDERAKFQRLLQISKMENLFAGEKVKKSGGFSNSNAKDSRNPSVRRVSSNSSE